MKWPAGQCRRIPVFARQDAPGRATEIFGVSVIADSADVFGMPSDSQWRRAPANSNRWLDDQVDPRSRDDAAPDRPASFAREKFLWLDQVCADPELTPLAFKLAYVLANLVNERQGFAWPSVAHLAAKCRVTENGAKKAIRQLSERGHLSVEFGSGRGKTNHYRWILKGANAGAVADKRDERSTTSCDRLEQRALLFSAEKGATATAPIDEKRGNPGSEKGQLAFQKGATPVAPTLFKESIYDLFYRLSSPRDAQTAASAFDDFWRIYPKKVALTDAIHAFARAISRAPPEEIIRGAMRYAAERDGEDPRYTKNPATWLSKACWNDPSPPVRGLSRDGPRRSNSFDRSIVEQLHDDGDFEEVIAYLQQQRDQRG